MIDQQIRAQLNALKARYPGKMPPTIWKIIRELEIELAWKEQQEKECCGD